MNSAELELLEAIARGDRQAMSTLYTRYLPRLWRFLLRVTQDRDMIQELTNDVMLTVWQKAAEFRRESTVSTWILGIAYLKALDAMRRANRYQESIRQLPEPLVENHEFNALIADHDLNTVMAGLSSEQRAVVELSFGFGYSYPEIAEILEIPVNTVKSRMYYARQIMQAAFEKRPLGGDHR